MGVSHRLPKLIRHASALTPVRNGPAVHHHHPMRRDQRQRARLSACFPALAVIEAIKRTVAVRLDLRVIHIEQPVEVTAIPGDGIGIDRLKQEPRVVGAVGKLRTLAIGLGHAKFAIAPVGLGQRPLGALEQRLPEVIRPRHLVEVTEDEGPAVVDVGIVVAAPRLRPLEDERLADGQRRF